MVDVSLGNNLLFRLPLRPNHYFLKKTNAKDFTRQRKITERGKARIQRVTEHFAEYYIISTLKSISPRNVGFSAFSCIAS